MAPNSEFSRAVLVLGVEPGQFFTVLDRAERRTKDLGGSFGSAGRDVRSFAAHIQAGTRELGFLDRATATAAGTFAGFGLAQTALSAASTGISALKTAVFGMNSTLETSTLQFGTLMGSSDKAKAHVKDLFQIAKETPFETGPIIEASRMLQTFGGEALNTKQNIVTLGDASAATGAPINELGFWVGRLYSNLQGGQPFGEAAMRLQELAVMSPQVRTQMETMQTAGKSADEIFKTFTTDLERFSGAMKAQAGTWQGVTSTFSDTIQLLAADVFEPAFAGLRDGLGSVNEFLASDTAAAWGQGLKDTMAEVKAYIITDLIPWLKDVGETGSSAVKKIRDTWAKTPEPVKDVATSVGEVALKTGEAAGAAMLVWKAFNWLGGMKVVQWAMKGGFGRAVETIATKIPGQALPGVGTQAPSTWGWGTLGRFIPGGAAVGAALQGGAGFLSPEEQHRRGLISDADYRAYQLATGHMPTQAPAGWGGPGFGALNLGIGAPSGPGAVAGIDASQLPAAEAAVGKLTAAQKKLKAATAEAAAVQKGLTAEQQAAIIKYNELGLSASEIASITKVNEGAVKHYTDELKEQQKRYEKLGDAAEKAATKAGEAWVKSYFEQQDTDAKVARERVQYFQKSLDEFGALQKEAQAVSVANEADSLEKRLALVRAEFEEKRKGLDRASSFYQANLAAIDFMEQDAAQKATQAWREHIQDLEKMMPSMRNVFSSVLADIPGQLQSAFTGGGGLSGAFKSIGTGINAGFGASLLQGSFGQSIAVGLQNTFGQGAATWFGKNAGALGGALGAGAGALGSWLSGKDSTAAKAAGGALSYMGTGAMIGSVIPGLGTAAGAAIGAAIGAIKGLLAKKPGKILGEKADKEIADLQTKLKETYGSLDKIGELGKAVGVDLAGAWGDKNVKGLEHFKSLTDDFVKALEQAQKRLQIISEKGLLLDKKSAAFLKTQKPEDIAAFVEGQTSAGIGNLGKIASGYGASGLADMASQLADAKKSGSAADIRKAQEEYDKYLKAHPLSKSAALGIGGGVAGLYAQMTESGASPTEIAAQLGPMVTALSEQFKALKISGGAAFNEIAGSMKYMADEGVAPLLEGAQGAMGLATSLANTGRLDEATFAGLAASVSDAKAQLDKMGKGGPEAMKALQPQLQRIWELEDQFGWKVDDATQKLIDQAVQEGKVGEQFKNPADKMLGAIDKLVDRMGDFIDAILGVPKAVEKIPKDIDLTARVHYRRDGADDDGTDAERLHTGRLITATLRRAHSGLLVGPSALAADEVPIIAQTGEEIVSRPVASLARWAVNAIKGGGGGSQTIILKIGERTLLQTMVEGMPRYLELRGAR